MNDNRMTLLQIGSEIRALRIVEITIYEEPIALPRERGCEFLRRDPVLRNVTNVDVCHRRPMPDLFISNASLAAFALN